MHQTPEMSGLKDETPAANCCVGCGKATVYVCPFCVAHQGPRVPLCGEPSCREKHESGGGCVRGRKVQR